MGKNEDAVLARAYEEAIGSLDAHHAQLLFEAQQQFGAECVLHALEAMTEKGVRSWRYAVAIMRRHADEGCVERKSADPGRDDTRVERLKAEYDSGVRFFGRLAKSQASPPTVCL